MSRIAYVVVPHLALQAIVRGEPELRGQPLGILDGDELVEVSAEAARLGLKPHMSVSEARMIGPPLTLRSAAPALERSAQAALADLAASFSPRLERSSARGVGEVAIDVSDLGRLFASEHEIASALDAAARRLGLEVRIAIAADKTTAHLGALSSGGPHVIAPGREPTFLARLPIELLAPLLGDEAEAVVETLVRWGVRRIGELESLPTGGVALRLGAAGARLGRIARGSEEAPLVCEPTPLVFEESIELDWSVENLQALGFVLRRLLQNLVARLACRSLAAGGLALSLRLEPRGVDERTVTVAAPTRDVHVLEELVRLQLEAAPPTAAITGLTVRATAGRARAAQLAFFEPPGPSPTELATALARLSALVGPARVGAPALLDRHRPDAFAMVPFSPSSSREGRSTPETDETKRTLALHRFRPPRPAEVLFVRRALRYLRGEGLGGHVLSAAGPFRLREGWWLGAAAADDGGAALRDYFDVELSDGGIYRIYHDRLRDAWLVDGCYE